MHLKTVTLVVAAALAGLSAAHPHVHALAHSKQHHQLRHVGLAEGESPAHLLSARRPKQFKKSGKKLRITTTATAPAATKVPEVKAEAPPTTSSTPAAAPTPASSAVKKPFCGGAASKRATLAQIGYVGNTGAPGQWGCNMMIIDAAAESLYDYTARFSAPSGTWTCACFNKIGPTGLIDGFWHTAVGFTVTAQSPVSLAFDSNSQGGCACGGGSSVPKTWLGQFAGTWLEFDMGNDSNGGNSGADASVLVAGAMGLPYIGMKISANGGVCSWVKSNGDNFAAYMPGMEDLDGIGCKGYHKNHLDIVLGDNF